MKILITGGNQAKALKLLKAFPSHFVLLADYGEVPGMVTEHYAFASMGQLNQDSIAHILLNFCITNAIDVIIPLHHFEVLPIAKSAILFEEYNIEVLLPPMDQLGTAAHQNAVGDLCVFIKGECIFTTGAALPANQSTAVNGVYQLDSLSGKQTLFTI